MDLHGPNSRIVARIDRVLKIFGKEAFTTKQFIDRFAERCPNTWNAVIMRYGRGGKGTGTVFTSSSFIANHLDKRRYNGTVWKFDPVKSPPGWGSPLITVWSNQRNPSKKTLFPDEIDITTTYHEGMKKTVTVNRYERDRRARRDCIAHYATNCSVCKMNFRKMYGESVEGFIHVHHIKPLSSVGRNYKVDPIADLRPVCPNCHAVLLANGTVLSIGRARALLRHAAREN